MFVPRGGGAHAADRENMRQHIEDLIRGHGMLIEDDTYEARLRLDESNKKKGIDPEGLKRLHLHEFDSRACENHHCPVCLDNYEEEEFVASMPTCKHQFHVGCIERWLQGSTQCPVCRGSMIR